MDGWTDGPTDGRADGSTQQGESRVSATKKEKRLGREEKEYEVQLCYLGL